MNYFSKLNIQENISTFFRAALQNDHLAHSYLFHGPQGSGKRAFSLELAKTLNCQSETERPCGECASCRKITSFHHPDIKLIFPVTGTIEEAAILKVSQQISANPYQQFSVEGNRSILIDQIRELKKETKYAAYEARKRFFIIDEAHLFSVPAANSFLKLLEEPPQNLILILISSEPGRLPDTLRSRCQQIHFPPFSEAMIQTILAKYKIHLPDPELAIRIAQHNLSQVIELATEKNTKYRGKAHKFLQKISGGNALELMEFIEDLSRQRDRQAVAEILNLLIFWFRDALHLQMRGAETRLINTDLAEAIRKFAGYYPKADYDFLVSRVEGAILDLERNAHLGITLTDLAWTLNTHLSESLSKKENAA